MNENEFYKLSDELMARRTDAGDAMLYQCEHFHHRHRPDEVLPIAVLNYEEMAELIAWYYENDEGDDSGLIAAIVRGVRRGEIPDRIAVVALRALMWHATVRASERTLEGWVMPTDEGEQE